jgi:hypothetical protein
MVTLIDAPDTCHVELERPRPMPDDVAARLYALPADVTKLPAELQTALRGVQGAILVECGARGPAQKIADATTALDALEAFATAEVPIVSASEPVSTVADDPIARWRVPLLLALAIGALGVVVTLLLRRRSGGRPAG